MLSKLWNKLKPLWRYRKAIVSAVMAGGALYLKADADDVITSAEWWEILSAAVAAAGVTWLVPNAPTPKREPEAVQHLRNQL